MKLTPRQKETYDIIAKFYQKKGYWPTYKELSVVLGVKSSAGPYRLIKKLQEKGYLEKVHGKARLFKFTNPVENDLLMKIALEAHTMGRVYNEMGEPQSPSGYVEDLKKMTERLTNH